MATAWFVVPYETRRRPPTIGPLMRFCAMDRYTSTIGPNWEEVEVLGNRALVKVSATPAQLNAIESAEGWQRFNTLTPVLRQLYAPRQKPRFDESGNIVLDGPLIPPSKSLEAIDSNVR